MDYALENLINCLDAGCERYPDNYIFSNLRNTVLSADGQIPKEGNLSAAFVAVPPEETEASVRTDSAPEPHTDIPNIRDLRCLHLICAGVRAYPSLNDGNAIGFGINCTRIECKKKESTSILKSGEPISTIILGSNGSGKTSLFTALEFVSKGHSSIADAHGYKDTQQRAFLEHQRGVKTSITLISNSEVLTYSDDALFPVPAAFFCCEDDIQKLEKEIDFTSFILTQVGYNLIHKLYTNIDTELKHLSTASTGDGATILTEAQNTHVKQVITFLQQYQHKRLSEIADVAKIVIPAIMNDYLKDDCEITPDYSGDSFKIILTLKALASDGTVIEDTPRRYFNTFRFKMFVVALKVALACCIKILDKINFPIVIDDVFDACDFQNKQKIRGFIRSIVKQHYDLMNEKNIKGLDLQLIFLTQDDIIARNLYHGIKTTETGMRVKLCRLYHPYNAQKEDDVTIQTQGGKLQYRSVTSLIESNYF